VLVGTPAHLVPYDLSRPQINAAPGQAWSRLHPERDDGTPARTIRVGNPRQAVCEPLHPQVMQIDAHDLRSKMTTPSDRELNR
jgi:hypothetical protein